MAENEFTLHVNEISFSYEKMDTKTRFEKEANGNSEMACWQIPTKRNGSVKHSCFYNFSDPG